MRRSLFVFGKHTKILSVAKNRLNAYLLLYIKMNPPNAPKKKFPSVSRVRTNTIHVAIPEPNTPTKSKSLKRFFQELTDDD